MLHEFLHTFNYNDCRLLTLRVLHPVMQQLYAPGAVASGGPVNRKLEWVSQLGDEPVLYSRTVQACGQCAFYASGERARNTAAARLALQEGGREAHPLHAFVRTTCET